MISSYQESTKFNELRFLHLVDGDIILQLAIFDKILLTENKGLFLITKIFYCFYHLEIFPPYLYSSHIADKIEGLISLIWAADFLAL